MRSWALHRDLPHSGLDFDPGRDLNHGLDQGRVAYFGAPLLTDSSHSVRLFEDRTALGLCSKTLFCRERDSPFHAPLCA